MKRYLILLLIPLIFASCKSKLEKELDLLEAYLDDNNIDIDPTSSGLYYIETLAGTGDNPVTGDVVSVHYTGKLIDGEKFDSSYDRGEAFEFTLGIGQVIKGWDEGIEYMKKGGKATLIIPSTLGYGPDGSGSIPGYSTLIFDVELLDITN